MEQRKRQRQEEEVSAFRSLPRKFPGVEVIKVTRASCVGQAPAALLVTLEQSTVLTTREH